VGPRAILDAVVKNQEINAFLYSLFNWVISVIKVIGYALGDWNSISSRGRHFHRREHAHTSCET
jgi:hypothetical protein